MDQRARLAITNLVFMVVFLVPAVADAANLLVNGDFSLGNTGFTSDYVFTSNTVPEGTYCVDTDPQNCHPGAASYPDHTGGNGLMLNANGAVSPDRIVWQQTVPVAPQTSYTFSGYAASWGDAGGFEPSPAQLRFFINGVQVGQDFMLTSSHGQWLLFVVHWDSESNTSATVEIVDVNIEGFGNDFSLDDLSLQEELALKVPIDIKPGSFPNSINPKSNGVIPVAILTTATFDATTVDPLSVEFGPSGATEAHGKGHIEDVNHDGEPDLVLHFRTQITGIKCGETSASLTGETFDGDPIQGSDTLKTVGCKK
jgi:hypothetical protein